MSPKNISFLFAPKSLFGIERALRSRGRAFRLPCCGLAHLLTALILSCFSQPILRAEDITVSSGTVYPDCGSHGYCESYGGHVTYHVHYTSLPAGNYRIDSANGIVVDFDNPTSGSGNVIGNG